MSIGENIRNVRKAKGLSQRQLGNSLGVSQAMIAQYENGIRNPKFDTLKNIAKKLDVTLNVLLNDNWNNYMSDIQADIERDTCENLLEDLYIETGFSKAVKDRSIEEIKNEIESVNIELNRTLRALDMLKNKENELINELIATHNDTATGEDD